MEDILYAKISNERDEKFQIITEVLKKDEKRFVRKSALHKDAYLHIQKIYANRDLLKDKYSGHADVKICNCEMQGKNIVFEYAEGKRADQYFAEVCATGNKEKIIEVLDSYHKLLYYMADSDKFEKTPEFINVFGDVEIKSSTVSGTNINVDMIFSNVILNDGYCIIDYEWVFPFSIPVEYVFYKALATSAAFSVLEEGWKNEIYEHFQLDQQKKNVYRKMEENFQAYVKGDKVSLSMLGQKFQLKGIHVDKLSWDTQGYYIKCFGRQGELADEIYNGMIQGDKISLEFVVEKKEYTTIEIFGAPIDSAIQVESIYGYKNGVEIPVSYCTTADFEEEGIGYYGLNTPVFIIENEGYEKIICRYNMKVWNNAIVTKLSNKVNESAYKQEQLEEQNSVLVEQKLQLEGQNSALVERKMQLEGQNSALIEQKMQLESQNNELTQQRNALATEINIIKNSRTWKIMSKIRGWE